jgi:hypothetical protein
MPRLCHIISDSRPAETSDLEGTLRTRLLATAAALMLLTAPAHAQFNLGGGGKERDRTRYTEEEKRNEAATEKAYRDAIKNTKGAVSESYDPWRNIRPATPEKKPR